MSAIRAGDCCNHSLVGAESRDGIAEFGKVTMAWSYLVSFLLSATQQSAISVQMYGRIQLRIILRCVCPGDVLPTEFRMSKSVFSVGRMALPRSCEGALTRRGCRLWSNASTENCFLEKEFVK